MLTQPHWVEGPWPGRLAVSARPRGGDWLEDEIQAWQNAGLDAVVSLLTPCEMEDLDLKSEESLCRRAGLDFQNLPIPDRATPPSESEARALILDIETNLRNGKNVMVHCRQGIGRAATISAAVLVASGIDLNAALERVTLARGLPVPETPEQFEWLQHFEALIHQPA